MKKNPDPEQGSAFHEHFYKKLIRTTKEGYWLVDRDGNLVDINQAYANMTGYSIEELKQLRISDVEALEDEKTVEEHNQHIMKHGSHIFQSVHKRKDGSRFDVEVNAVFLEEEQLFVGFIRDISDEIEARNQLEKSKALYRDLVETSQDLIWQCDTEGRYTYLNPAWESVFGYSLNQMIGQKFTRFQNPETAQSDVQMFLKLLKGDMVKGHETRHIGKDGKDIHLVFNAKAAFDEKGEITGTRGTAYDITERNLAAQRIRESEEKYRALVQSSPNIITEVDRHGKFVFVNNSSNKIFGVDPDSCVGTSAFDFIHPEDRNRTETWFQHCILTRKEKNSFENRQVNKVDGTVYSVLWSVTFQYDEAGSCTGSRGIGQDVTAIRKAEQNYASLFEKMLDGFALHEILCDAQGHPIDYRFLDVNPAFERLTGLKRSNLLGKTVLEVMPDTELHWIETYGNVALSGEPCSFKNFSVELGKHFEVTAYCPAPNQFACIFVDITREVKDQEEKRLLETRIHQAQKMEAIGTLSGGIAHDFNNILAAILGFAEMARSDIPTWSPASYQINEVLKAGNRARDLVKQILTFSRQTEHKKRPVEIYKIIKEAAGFLRATIPTSIDIHLNLNPNCGQILGDPTQIHQVLMNLCVNASHAMENRGGMISIELEPVSIGTMNQETQGNSSSGNYIQLLVKDTGAGIKEEHLDRIFDPYFTTKNVGEGTGMGLSVVHGIVKTYQGHISVESEYGKGTVFRILFPRCNEESVLLLDQTQELPSGTEHILIIDDEKAIIELTETRLLKLGYKVTSCGDSSEALALLKGNTEAFDLIITDQTMPHLTGIQLASKLKQGNIHLPVILCSGYRANIRQEDLKNTAICLILEKPYTNKQLSEAIRIALKPKAN